MDELLKEIRENEFNVFNECDILFKGIKQLNKLVDILIKYENILYSVKTDWYFKGFVTLYKIVDSEPVTRKA